MTDITQTNISNTRVTIITRSYPSKTRPVYNGGVEKVMVVLSRHLSATNKVTVLTQKEGLDNKDICESEGEQAVQRVGRPVTKYVVNIKHLLDILNVWLSYVRSPATKMCDVIIAGDHTTYIPAVIASAIYGKGLVIFWHDFLGVKWLSFFGFLGLGGMLSELLALSHPNATHWSLTTYTNQKIRKKSISKSMYKYELPEQEKPTIRHNTTRKEKQILMVGRLVGYKNHMAAILLFERFIKEYGGWRMSIVGHGPEKPKLEVLTKTRHLSDYVVIKEGLSDQDLLKEYARSKIFLHLSELEGFSLSIFEALSMGCRVIALYLPVYDEVYKGRLNYLYQKDDNEGFVNYMLS